MKEGVIVFEKIMWIDDCCCVISLVFDIVKFGDCLFIVGKGYELY